jgi:hypothetical protein
MMYPVLANGKETTMDSEALLAEVKAKQPHAASLAIRHVGAYVSTLTTITADRLARLKPIHETHEGADIASAFGAIEAAEPAPSTESSEPRWHLTFADKSGAAILVVTTASSAPWHGTIEGHRVAYRTDRLVKWLTDRYAPDEASAVR